MANETAGPTLEDPDEVKKQNRKEFWGGVAFWFGLNIAMWVVLSVLTNLTSSAAYAPDTPQFLSDILQGLTTALLLLPYAVNIGLIIYFFARHRKQVALGMLGGFGIALGLVVCAGLLFVAYCFIGLSA